MEAKLRRSLQSFGGSVAMHQGRMVLAVSPPAPPGCLVVGVAAGGGLVLIEPPGVVSLNGELSKTIEAEETAGASNTPLLISACLCHRNNPMYPEIQYKTCSHQATKWRSVRPCETAIDAIRRRLTYDVAAVVVDLTAGAHTRSLFGST